MWVDLTVLLGFCLMILVPCFMAVNAGTWGTEEDGGYERGTHFPFARSKQKTQLGSSIH